MCLRNDLAGPGTCFAFQAGLDTAAVLGVCRSDVASVSKDATGSAVAAADSGEGGVCNQPPLTLPSCVDSPPLNDGGSPTEAGVPEGSSDAEPTESSLDAAAESTLDAPAESSLDAPAESGLDGLPESATSPADGSETGGHD